MIPATSGTSPAAFRGRRRARTTSPCWWRSRSGRAIGSRSARRPRPRPRPSIRFPSSTYQVRWTRVQSANLLFDGAFQYYDMQNQVMLRDEALRDTWCWEQHHDAEDVAGALLPHHRADARHRLQRQRRLHQRRHLQPSLSRQRHLHPRRARDEGGRLVLPGRVLQSEPAIRLRHVTPIAQASPSRRRCRCRARRPTS